MGGVQRCWLNELNNFTLEVLNILEKMIMLGFYGKEDDIIDILNPVISLLDGSMDFVTQDEEDGYNLQEEKNEANKDKPTYTPEKFDRDKEARYKKSP